jgi:hypothetical protein
LEDQKCWTLYRKTLQEVERVNDPQSIDGILMQAERCIVNESESACDLDGNVWSPEKELEGPFADSGRARDDIGDSPVLGCLRETDESIDYLGIEIVKICGCVIEIVTAHDGNSRVQYPSKRLREPRVSQGSTYHRTTFLECDHEIL